MVLLNVGSMTAAELTATLEKNLALLEEMPACGVRFLAWLSFYRIPLN